MRLALIEIPDNYDLDALPPGAVLRGLFQKPTKYCKCGSGANTVRGMKYSWWVCPECKKPKAHTTHRPRNLLHPRWLAPFKAKVAYYVTIDTYQAAELTDGTLSEETDTINIWREQYSAKQREEGTPRGEGPTPSTA